jgi:hypothetical protein
MINVIQQNCAEVNCLTQPCFNYEGQVYPLYCVAHMKKDMVNVKDKRCLEPDCVKQPHFNYKGQTKGVYCASHCKIDMINVITPTCQENNCNTVPTFNYKFEKKGIYCVLHKKETMVDVKNKSCLHADCEKQPIFNFKDHQRGEYCISHKTPDMVDVVHEKCIHPLCFARAYFNNEGQKKGIYCASHKTADLINVYMSQCRTPHCTTSAKEKYEGYCFPCFIHMFPEKPNASNYKTKERSVVEYILNAFPDKTWIADKRVADGCSRRRPDIYLDMGSHLIMIEVDENQHMDYDLAMWVIALLSFYASTPMTTKKVTHLYRDIGVSIRRVYAQLRRPNNQNGNIAYHVLKIRRRIGWIMCLKKW